MRLILTALCVISFAALAVTSEVLQYDENAQLVEVTQVPESPFEKNDRLCVTQKKLDVACGDVEVSENKRALIRLDFFREEIKKKKKKHKKETVVELEFQYPLPVYI